MAASSSSSKQVFKYDVFPSFRGEDVRRGFLSYLLREFECKGIKSFNDHGIERSHNIANELLLAINEARIAIVIFSKNYADSTWCLTELVEIHKCSKDTDRMVIPIFYDVDPSDVRKLTGGFGECFRKTSSKGKYEIQSWEQALTDIAKIAGEDLRNGPSEVYMVEKIANDVSNKLIPLSNGLGDSVGIEAQIEAMKSPKILSLESEEARMIGIWGPSGIGKTTLGRGLFSHLSPGFHFRIFTTYEDKDKLSWEQKFMSEILVQENLKIENPGTVKERLKYYKVLIVLDDVDNLEFLKTLVGETKWFGPGSRIIVITQNKHLLDAHKIKHLYKVEIPVPVIALKMFCRSAFDLDSPPDGFKELADEVVKIAGNLPLDLNALGSSLKGRTKEDWMESLPELRISLQKRTKSTLMVSYDRLQNSDQKLFLYIACLFNGKSVKFINDFFEDVNAGLKRLVEKSLVHITKLRSGERVVQMHNLLEKLGREIVRAEGKPQFLWDAGDIEKKVFSPDQPGKKTLLGISFEALAVKSTISLHEKSFQKMSNLQFLKIHNQTMLRVPDDLVYLPRYLKCLDWNYCPLKCLPSNFNAEYLVELRMEDSKLEKLWEGTQQLGSFKTIAMRGSKYLKEIPDLSKAIKLERIEFSGCDKLESGLDYLPPNLQWLGWDNCPLKCLPSNFKTWCLVELKMEYSKLEKLWEGTQKLGSLKTIMMRESYYLKEIPDLSGAINLERLDFSGCSKLQSFPSPLGSESLVYLNFLGCSKLQSFPSPPGSESLVYLNFLGCSLLKNFPEIKMESLPHGIKLEVKDCLWNKNLPGLNYLDCLKKRCYPIKIFPEHMVSLEVKGSSTMEKLWEGVQPLGSLHSMDLSKSENLKEIPDLSKATNLKVLFLSECKSLVRLPSTIGNLQKLETLEMKECTGLEVLPVDVNLSSLKTLDLSGCSSLTSFPQLSHNIEEIHLDLTAIEEIPCCIEMFRRLTKLSMWGCYKLKNISANIFRLTNLKQVDFTDCGGVIRALAATINETIEKGNTVDKDKYFKFQNCLKLDRDARELIMQSSFKCTVVLPGGEVPTYFEYRASGNSLPVTLPESSLSHYFLRFNVCVVVEPLVFQKLCLQFHFGGVLYKHVVDVDMSGKWETNHLYLFSFKFQPTGILSKLDFKDVKFQFTSPAKIKQVGIRVLNMSPSPDDREGRSFETLNNQQPGESCDVVATESCNKQMQMTTSDQIVTNTGLMAPNLERPLERGESSSLSSYPCQEGEILWIDSMITEQQDALIPTVNPHPDDTRPSSSSTSSATSERAPSLTTRGDRRVLRSSISWASASIFSCWGGLCEIIKLLVAMIKVLLDCIFSVFFC